MLQPIPLPWEEPSWLGRVEAWVVQELDNLGLARSGRLELVRTRPWAAVCRIATGSGMVWFKEPAPQVSFEPALTVAVSRLFPDFTPDVLAAQGSWMLTCDAGVQFRFLLRRRAPAPAWEDLLPRYAELQIRAASDIEHHLRLGVPDKRAGSVVEAYSGLVERIVGGDPATATRLQALLPAVASLADELDELPHTLIHEEVTGSNVFVRDGHARLLDWGEASVSHPFAGVTNTLRDIAYRRRLRPNGRAILHLRSAYLEPWGQFGSPSELARIFERAYLFGTLCRAMSWDHIITGQSQEVRTEYRHNAAVWLDIFREGLQDGVRLGAS